MKTLGILATITALVGAFALAVVATRDVGAADAPCVRKDFKTELVKAACTKGGQKAAKDAMKAWNSEKKIKSCNQCHSKLAPNYELKADAYDQFQKLGGKLLAATTATAKSGPVEASFVRIDPKAEVMVYKVTVNDADIEQVDLEFSYLDAGKKELKKESFAWQNNVKGTVQPIDKAKSYEAKDSGYPPGTVGATIKVKRVHFKGGKKWTPDK